MYRTVVIAAGIYPPEVGGVATVAARLADELVRRGCFVTVVTYSEGEKGPEAVTNPRVIRVSRAGSTVARYYRYFRALRACLQDDAVLCVTDVLSVGLPARIATLLRRSKVVVRLGGERAWEDAIQKGLVWCSLREYWRNQRGGIRQVLMRYYYRWFFGMADDIVFVSSLLKECLAFLPSKTLAKVRIIPNRAASSQRSDEQERRPHQPLEVAFLGRMERVKNLDFLKKLMERVRGVRFQVVSVRLGEVQDLLSRVDVLVLPSITDIYPNVVIEALEAGVPVLMTSEHGLEPGFGGVMYAAPNDERAWLEALRTMMNPDAYQTLRANIRIPDYHGPSLADIVLQEK